jgi:DNA-directed RNA polymerase specialized sigma24 family protein
MYDKKAIKQFILSCHERINFDYELEPIETDDFFNLGAEVDNKPIDQMNTEDAIFLNELELAAEMVGTFKEFNLFLLMSEGKSYEDIARVFDISISRVWQMLDKLLSKIEQQLNNQNMKK